MERSFGPRIPRIDYGSECAAMRSRRDFIALAGKSVGLAALSVPAIGALLKEVEAASRNVAHLVPEQVAMDEDYWSVIQNSFTVTRGIVNPVSYTHLTLPTSDLV